MNTQKNRGIHWTDGEGNERVISRDAWRADILPRVLAGHWHDADLLFLDVVIRTEDGFREEMLLSPPGLLSAGRRVRKGRSLQRLSCRPKRQGEDALSGSAFQR